MNSQYSNSTDSLTPNTSLGMKRLPTEAEIQAWLITHLAQLLDFDPEMIDATLPFERYGLDSSDAVVLSGDLQEWLGRELDPILLFDYPTIEAVATHLA